MVQKIKGIFCLKKRILPIPEFVVWSTLGPVFWLGVAPALLNQSNTSNVSSLVQPHMSFSKSQNPTKKKPQQVLLVVSFK